VAKQDYLLWCHAAHHDGHRDRLRQITALWLSNPEKCDSILASGDGRNSPTSTVWPAGPGFQESKHILDPEGRPAPDRIARAAFGMCMSRADQTPISIDRAAAHTMRDVQMTGNRWAVKRSEQDIVFTLIEFRGGFPGL